MRKAFGIQKPEKIDAKPCWLQAYWEQVLCEMCMAIDMRAWKWCGGKIVSVQYGLINKYSRNI